MKTLIAGIGNVLHGDDAFGCEVVRQLAQCALPPGVTVTDFGIRTGDLARALAATYDVIILVDAAPCNKEPGTLYLIEPDTRKVEACCEAEMDSHSMNPVSAIQKAQQLGGIHGKLYVVGCEPAVLENSMGELGLSLRVQHAIPQALAMIESLLANLVEEDDESLADILIA